MIVSHTECRQWLVEIETSFTKWNDPLICLFVYTVLTFVVLEECIELMSWWPVYYKATITKAKSKGTKVGDNVINGELEISALLPTLLYSRVWWPGPPKVYNWFLYETNQKFNWFYLLIRIWNHLLLVYHLTDSFLCWFVVK